MHVRSLPRPALAALAAGVVCAGTLAATAPAAGAGLAVLAVLVAIVIRLPLPRLGRVAVLVAVVTAILGPNLALPQAPQAFTFRVVIVLLGLGLAVYTLVDGRLVVPRGLPRPAGLLIALALWSLVSISWSQDQVAAIRWTAFLIMMGGLAIAIPLAFRARRTTRQLVVVLGAAFLLSTLTAIAQLRFGVRLATTTVLGSGDSAFAASLFGNQNNFATYLTLTLPYFLCLPVVTRDARLQAVGVGGTVLTLGALMFTGSRSNLIAAALVIGGLVVVTLLERRRGGRLVAIGVAAAAVLLVVPSVVGGGILPIPESAVEKFDVTVLLRQIKDQQGSGAVRQAVLQEGLSLVRETAGRGVGAGNAETRITALDSFTGVENLHNWWMEVLVNLGVPGLVLFVALYLHLMRGQLRAARRTDDPMVRWLGLAGALALLGFVVGSLGPSSVIHFAPMWITLGLGMLTLVRARDAHPPT